MCGALRVMLLSTTAECWTNDEPISSESLIKMLFLSLLFPKRAMTLKTKRTWHETNPNVARTVSRLTKFMRLCHGFRQKRCFYLQKRFVVSSIHPKKSNYFVSRSQQNQHKRKLFTHAQGSPSRRMFTFILECSFFPSFRGESDAQFTFTHASNDLWNTFKSQDCRWMLNV